MLQRPRGASAVLHYEPPEDNDDDGGRHAEYERVRLSSGGGTTRVRRGSEGC